MADIYSAGEALKQAMLMAAADPTTRAKLRAKFRKHRAESHAGLLGGYLGGAYSKYIGNDVSNSNSPGTQYSGMPEEPFNYFS